jgi:phosphate transport system substrate-binding protein
MNKILILSALISLLFLSCDGGSENGKKLSTPTSGETTIVADETLQPVISATVDSFHDNYSAAKITALYLPEGEAVKLFMEDSVQVAVLGRDLTPEEKDYFKKIELPVHSTKIAYDAITLIVNKGNKVSVLKLSQLKDILLGKIRYWSDIEPSLPRQEIQVVFDHSASSTVSYLKKHFNLPDQLPSHFYAVKTNPQVIDYTEKNPNALGIIGLNWVSDHDDSMATGFLKRIKMVGLSAPEGVKGAQGEYYEPYQLYIKQGLYPLTREVYIVNREPRTGLGTGFVSYIAGNKGQTIIHLSGLVSPYSPVRVIEFKDDIK